MMKVLPMRLLIAVFLVWLHASAFADPIQVEIVATGLGYTEGTVFAGQKLYFVDYSASTVYRLDEKGKTLLWHERSCGANGLLALPDGLLVACYDSGTIQKITLDGKPVESLDRDAQGRPFDRPNDLAQGHGGGVYFTASGGDRGIAGKVYYLAGKGVPAREVVDSIQNANGVAVSPDGKVLYLGESGTDKILRFDISDDGSLRNQRDFLKLDVALGGAPGTRHTPDGIRTDSQGRLFVSLYNGGGFAVFDTAGNLLANVPVPGQHHANLALSPDEKYITGTTSEDSSDAQQNGTLYRVANPMAK